jgi:limonene-1,2-epoxide hydrolase
MVGRPSRRFWREADEVTVSESGQHVGALSLNDALVAPETDMQAFVGAYQAAWASQVPGIMRSMWHPDGVLHHPALGRPVGADVVPHNNDFTKAALADFSWTLTRWASRGEHAFLEWRIQATIDGEAMTWQGVDVMVVRQGRIAEERVYFDTYPLRRKRDPSLPDVPLVDPDSLGAA